MKKDNLKVKSTFLFCYILLFFCSSCQSTDTKTRAIRELTARLIPEKANLFEFQLINNEKDSIEYFELYSQKEKIIIRGTQSIAMAVGLNYYLQKYCLTTVSWKKNSPIQMPRVLPKIKEKIRIDARVNNRFFLNYCTFGYSIPWWKWSDWEHFIDWMALNGINMPLAITGQESIWYKVWKKHGMTDQEIREFFVGPAHLPWQRMSNLDYWQGPLPKEWLTNQENLQKKIIARERELDMKPILPAFSGHVPKKMKSLYPKAQISQMSEWNGFKEKYRCYFLSSTDSLYSVIQKDFLSLQTEAYGTDHIYGLDPFNEVDPPSWKADSLGILSKNIYKSLSAIDPKAQWLQMGWMFYENSENWTTKRIEHFLKAVPKNKVILLDYFCDKTEVWKYTDRFYGQPWIWCYLGNFGGNSMLTGNIKTTGERIENAIATGGKNLYGIGSTLEGFGVNQAIYEYVLQKAWNFQDTDTAWINNLADRHLGSIDENARKTWSILYDKILTASATVGQATLTNAHPSLKGNWYWTTNPEIPYKVKTIWQAWSSLLKVKKCNRKTHLFDLVNIGRQSLGDLFHLVRNEFTLSYEKRDEKQMKIHANRMLSILKDMDELLSFHPSFSLDHWLKQARDFGNSEKEKKYYEKNARTIITLWGNTPELSDYGNRSWAGLMRSFYAKRWEMFINSVFKSFYEKKQFNQKKFDKEVLKFEQKWIDPNQFKIEKTPSNKNWEERIQLIAKKNHKLLKKYCTE